MGESGGGSKQNVITMLSVRVCLHALKCWWNAGSSSCIQKRLHVCKNEKKKKCASEKNDSDVRKLGLQTKLQEKRMPEKNIQASLEWGKKTIRNLFFLLG